MSSSNDTTTANKVSPLNIVNVIAYTFNALIVLGIDSLNLFPSNAELSIKYQTLVTPSPLTFAIWGVIFLAELVFAVVQILPRYRSSDLVVTGVGYSFAAACLAQIIWTFAFGYELIAFSLGAMVSILIPLVRIITTSDSIKADSILDYWTLKFPFQIHGGWIMAATLVNINVLLVSMQTSSNVQVLAAWASFATVLVVAVYFIYRRIWVVPCVLAWASYGISSELSEPQDSITEKFSESEVSSFQQTAFVLSIGVLVAIVIRLVLDRFITKPDDDGNDGSNRDDSYRAANERATLVN
mmetsp:Transcript_2491/g.6724  ORF Transcript_2491/g.6724 Transcript_2491/m.6724 type:complete len:298 (-) Transcript_2491:483-1376(-)